MTTGRVLLAVLAANLLSVVIVRSVDTAQARSAATTATLARFGVAR